MLLAKKSKNIDEKPRKTIEPTKKSKKTKNLSPNRPKVTPQKRYKKDENSYTMKTHLHNNTQPIEMHKYKERDTWKNTTKKFSDNKSKLLTTSPVVFDRSHSTSHKKSKDKSKSRSVSRVHTHRSYHGDKERQMLKNVTRKLYTQNKEVLRQKSHSKSKSKSKSRTRINTDRDISPIREAKKTKAFNVADREVKLKKNESQPKKVPKKKTKKTKVEMVYSYMPTERPQQEQQKVKLKKKVPHIKTEFSERRGSFFDENLLKRLQLRQPDEKYPFSHIKSNRDEKIESENVDIFSRSEMKTFEEISSNETNKQKQFEQFRRDQEQKWTIMLEQLHDLKEEQKVPEKIDQIIKQLNENYNSLQERASVLIKNNNRESKQSSEEEYIKPRNIRSFSEKENQKEERDEEEERQQQVQQNTFIYRKAVEEKREEIIELQPSQAPDEIILQRPKKLRIEQKNNEQPTQMQQRVQTIVDQNITITKQIQNYQVQFNFHEIEPEKQQQANEFQPQQKSMEPQIRKTNEINLNRDFFDFFQNKKDNKLKLEILNSEPEHPNQNNNISSQSIKEPSPHLLSDKDLLESLNIIEGSSDFVEIISFNRESHKFEFQAELEEIRQIQSEEFHHILPHASFQNEVKIPEEGNSDSILLQSDKNQNNEKLDYLIGQVEHILVLQFCTNILRSKEILHNFLSTYSELVDQKVINDNYNEERRTIQCDNAHIIQILRRLLNHIDINYKQYFISQLKMSFQCKPIDILKFIRCSQDEQPSLIHSDKSSESNLLAIPFFGMEKIEEFQQDVLKNQYYLPNYFSFNHAIYDLFNEVIDDIRPYGAKGKSIFSMQLSHSVRSYQDATEKVITKFEECLEANFYEEMPQEQKYPRQEGIFELTYFTCLDVMEELFDMQTLAIYQVMHKR